MHPDPVPDGNLEPGTLARFIVSDFTAAWDAMSRCSDDPDVGGNFMFARQAFNYLELAARTASRQDTCLVSFAQFLAERDERYFSRLPASVPLPAEFRLPALPGVPPDRQLLAAMFDMSRHGLAHLYQQTPVDLTDGKQWITTFTGVAPGRVMAQAGSVERRAGHLAYRLGPNSGRVHLLVHPDVLLADLVWAARLAAIFSQYLAPEYLARPRQKRPQQNAARRPVPYAFTSAALARALHDGGHPQENWPVSPTG